MYRGSAWSIAGMAMAAFIASWFLFGSRIAFQVLAVAALTFLATGRRYRWFYILYKTLPRDVQAAYRFVIVNLRLKHWSKRNMTAARLFSHEVVPQRLSKVAFHFEGKGWTYSLIEEYSNKVGNYVAGLKTATGDPMFNRGDAIALVMENCPEYVCIWLGLAKVGIVTALVNSNLRRQPLCHSIKVANSKAIIFCASLGEAVAEIYDDLEGLPLFQLGKSNSASDSLSPTDLESALLLASTTLPPQVAEGSCRDKLMYIYTSGTTGLPKAAVITNLRFMFMAIGVRIMLGLSEEDIVYNPLPLYHTAGGLIGAGLAVLGGNTVALRKKFSASNFWKDCVTYKCTVAQYIGEICRYLLSVPEGPEQKEHTIRLMFGNGLRPQIWKTFVDRFRVKQIGELYGATEGNSNIINIDGTVGAVGFVPRYARKIYPMALIRVDEETGEPIRGEDGLCIRCEPGEPGISVAKINNRNAINAFHGYVDKKASEKKIIHDVFSKGDSAFNSGDILVMDEFGYFFFKDRTGDTFRWKGENVATSEVEAVISNIVGLKDAVVYGVEVPDAEGRAGMAAIVDEEGTINLEELAEGMKKSLPAYARPLFLRVLRELPMTVNIDGTVRAVGFVPRYARKIYPMALIRVDEETGEPIRGEDGLCIRCEPGEPGISVAKINNRNAINAFHGYVDKKASEKKIIHDVFSKEDSAFNSGDILVMDEFGYFFFKDRTGDTFRWKGENVATSEVEAVISNIVGLKDADVYGVEQWSSTFFESPSTFTICCPLK